MGWSPLDDGQAGEALLGDEAYDLMSEALQEIAGLYERDLGRKPGLREIVGTVKAVLEARLQDVTSEGEAAELAGLSFKTRPIPKRQRYNVGDVLSAEATNGEAVYGRVFDDDEALGPMVGVYDSLGMSPRSLDEIVKRPLIVKVFPIHVEILQKRGWRVIGNRPISKTDGRAPRGPKVISGRNLQLEAANHYYGLEKSEERDIDDFLVPGRRRG